jgi:hypothetical protein
MLHHRKELQRLGFLSLQQERHLRLTILHRKRKQRRRSRRSKKRLRGNDERMKHVNAYKKHNGQSRRKKQSGSVRPRLQRRRLHDSDKSRLIESERHASNKKSWLDRRGNVNCKRRRRGQHGYERRTRHCMRLRRM